MAKDLPSFIRALGVEEAARILEERPRTVRAWMYGERLPRPKRAARLIEKTKHRKDRLSLSTIYGSTQ